MSLRKRFKRAAAFMAAAGIAFIYVAAIAALPVRAEEKTGYWKLKETKVRVDESQLTSSTGWQYSASASELSHMYRAHLPANDYHPASTAVFTATCTPPPEVINKGDKVVMSMALDMDDASEMLVSQYCEIETGGLNDERDGLAYNVGDRFEATKEDAEYTCFMDTCGNPSNPTAEVYHVFNETGRPQEERVIEFYGCYAATIWIYEWIDTTPAAVAEEQPEPAPEDDFTKPDKDEAPVVSEEPEPEAEAEPEPEDEPYIEQDVYNEAITESGEDEGSDVIPAIIVGFGSAIAAGGALAAGKKSGRDTDDEEEEKKRFKMFISKDFGDTIRKGSVPVAVRARIDEITATDARIPRNELTQKIRVSGDGIGISSLSMKGSWIEAEVYADENSKEDTGTLTFTYSSEYGSFRDHVRFRLAGKPYIVFPDAASYSDGMYLKMMRGDTDAYSVRFFFEDAIGEPTSLTITGDERFRTEYRPAENERTYYADVTLVPGSSEESVFAEAERGYISIHAEFENKDEVDSGFDVEIWPEGLSIKSRHIENGRLVVYTYENKEAGDLDYKIKPTDFEPRLCYKDQGSGEAVFLTGEDIKAGFSDIYEAEKYGNTFTENFRYKVEAEYDVYAIAPEDTLPMVIEGYDVLMDMTCSADGRDYKAAIPIRFMGERPLPPSRAERKAALERLKKTIEYYGIGGNVTINSMIKNVEYYSAADIDFLRDYIILIAIYFYHSHSREHTKFGNLCDKYIVVGSAMVKAGDMAFKVIMTRVFAKGGDIAADFINPFKNMFFNWVGQYYGLGAEPEMDKEPVEFTKTLYSGCKDALEGVITGEEAPSGEALGVIVASYLMVCFLNHFYYGEGKEKGDVYRSLLAACGELGIAKLKEFVFKEVAAYSKDFMAKIQNWFGSMFKGFFAGAAQQAAEAAKSQAFTRELTNYAKTGLNAANVQTALNVGAVAGAMEERATKLFIDMGASSFGKDALTVVDCSVGFVLNYILHGKINKLDEVEDLKATEFLFNQLLKSLGIEAENVYVISENTFICLSSVKIKGGVMTIGFKNFAVDIDVVANVQAFLDLFYDFCFSWMKDIYKYCTKDMSALPDERDFMEYNEQTLDDSLEKLKKPQPIRFRSLKETE